MEVVSINTRRKEQVQEEEQKKAMLEVVDFIRQAIDQGLIKEFVACSIDNDGECQIHVAAMDMPGSVGLFEIGKHILITGETTFD
jgi:phosphoribosylformimino-5-aminoimidazole carboxamide ribonucleotide (ProFAR) isomerase